MVTLNTSELKERLKGADINPSAPRLAIASFVCNTMSHPTAEDVKREVERSFPSVSLATVYNTLNLFVEKGILREVKDPATKSVRYDPNVKPHYHFIDEETGAMMDLDPRVLRINPDLNLLGRDFQITGIEVTLRGHKKSK